MITFYGHFSGLSSYPQVCYAIARAIAGWDSDLKLCDLRKGQEYRGLEDVDRVSLGDWQSVQDRAFFKVQCQAQPRPGVGLTFGFPEWTRYVWRHERNVGYHVCDVDRIPPQWVDAMNRLDLVLTPSHWCKSVFRSCGVRTRVEVVYHGVHPVHGTHPSDPPPGGPLRLVHFCSAIDPARKGTLELLTAWEQIIGLRAVLIVHSDSPEVVSKAQRLENVLVMPQEFVEPREQYRRYWAADLIVQPSRAEGFGLCPLESRAAGVPIVTTCCTGHEAHEPSVDSQGVVVIPTGDLEPCGTFGLAPSLDPSDIADGLLRAVRSHGTLRVEARAAAKSVEAQWAWPTVLEPLKHLL